ncbi:hypothetical protein KIPB_001889 [Kipferlia bialata]|uniref:Uncharacterized protein n=1 Tax=Kipferlia bialata TaxID=797122 RepID=A0A9K3GFI4_9EUKA|nr:hypothetical protein KIPB_001889 [Kipferlia bialata]|eukprot:g1889.t1
MGLGASPALTRSKHRKSSGSNSGSASALAASEPLPDNCLNGVIDLSTVVTVSSKEKGPGLTCIVLTLRDTPTRHGIHPPSRLVTSCASDHSTHTLKILVSRRVAQDIKLLLLATFNERAAERQQYISQATSRSESGLVFDFVCRLAHSAVRCTSTVRRTSKEPTSFMVVPGDPLSLSPSPLSTLCDMHSVRSPGDVSTLFGDDQTEEETGRERGSKDKKKKVVATSKTGEREGDVVIEGISHGVKAVTFIVRQGGKVYSASLDLSAISHPGLNSGSGVFDSGTAVTDDRVGYKGTAFVLSAEMTGWLVLEEFPSTPSPSTIDVHREKERESTEKKPLNHSPSAPKSPPSRPV